MNCDESIYSDPAVRKAIREAIADRSRRCGQDWDHDECDGCACDCHALHTRWTNGQGAS